MDVCTPPGMLRNHRPDRGCDNDGPTRIYVFLHTVTRGNGVQKTLTTNTQDVSITSSAHSLHDSCRRGWRRLVLCRTVLVDNSTDIVRGRRHTVQLRRRGRRARTVRPKVSGHPLDSIRTSVLSTPREGAGGSQEARSRDRVDHDIEKPRSGKDGSPEKGCGGWDRAFNDQLANSGNTNWKHLFPRISETRQRN